MASMTIYERRDIEPVELLIKKKKITTRDLIHSADGGTVTSKLPPPASICSDHERYAWIKNRIEQTRLEKELNHIRLQSTLQGSVFNKEKHVIRSRSAKLTNSAQKMRAVLEATMSKSKLLQREEQEEVEEDADDDDVEDEKQVFKSSQIKRKQGQQSIIKQRSVMTNGWIKPKQITVASKKEEHTRSKKSSQEDNNNLFTPRQVVFASGLHQRDKLLSSSATPLMCSHVTDFTTPPKHIVQDRTEPNDPCEENGGSCSSSCTSTTSEDSVFDVLHKITKSKGEQRQEKSLLERLTSTKFRGRPKTAPEAVTPTEQQVPGTAGVTMETGRAPLQRYSSVFSSRALSLAQLRKDLKQLQENRSVVQVQKPKLQDFLTCEKLRFQGCQSKVDVFCQKLSTLNKTSYVWDMNNLQKKLNLGD